MNLGDKADPLPRGASLTLEWFLASFVLILAPCKLHSQAMTLETQIFQKAKFKDTIPMSAHWFLL